MLSKDEKIEILIDLYIHGEIDREDYIILRKTIEANDKKIQEKEEEESGD